MDELKRALRDYLVKHDAPLSGVKLRQATMLARQGAFLNSSANEPSAAKPDACCATVKGEQKKAHRKFAKRATNRGLARSNTLKMSAALDVDIERIQAEKATQIETK